MVLSDEDRLILNGEMFFSVRKFIRQNKSSAETIAKVDEVLAEGANINACDSNDNNNTILHVAAQKEQKDLVVYLLQKGAHIISNSEEKTAVHLALQNNTVIGREIAGILSKKGESPARRKGATIKQLNSPSEPSDPHNNLLGTTKTVTSPEIRYAKRAGTSGVSGQFYETKLLTLILHRALHDKQIQEFYLAANIKDIGDFDDICFRFQNTACFVQAKHFENTEKAKLTVASVRSMGKLGLGKYFDSFLKIRQKFSPSASDPMFKGNFMETDSYFILYTPLKECFERKVSGQRQMCNKMQNIIFSSDGTENLSRDVFQFDYDESDLDSLIKFVKDEHMKMLAKTFLEFILSSNKLQTIMSDDLLKVYHPALAQKVIHITKTIEPPRDPMICNRTVKVDDDNSQNNVKKSCIPTYQYMGSFRPDFFTSEDYNLKIIKDTFYKEIVYTHAQKTGLSKDEVKQKVQNIAQNPCPETISELIGSPIKFDEVNDKLILDVSKLPKNKYKSNEIQQIQYELQKIQVSSAMLRGAVHLAGQKKIQALSFKLPPSFGNTDLTTNQKTLENVRSRLDFLVGKINSLINYFAERNKDNQHKLIEISAEVVGPRNILELSHLSSNGGIGGAVGNLLRFNPQTELLKFNTSEKLGENADYVLNKLKELTGEDLNSYSIKVNIDGFPRTSFDTYKYDKNLAAEFMSKLWFYTNQAQEEAVESTIKKEINIHYNADKQHDQFLFHVHADAIFLRFHDEVQKWWKKQTEAHYLTKTTNIFERAKKDIVNSPLLTVLNIMFIRNIQKFGITFNKDAVDRLNLDEFVNKDILNIVSDAVILSAAKIMHSDNQHSKYTFLNLDYVTILPENDHKTMIEEIKALRDITIVIISENLYDQKLKCTLKNIIMNIFTRQIDNVKNQIIIITREPINNDEDQIISDYDFITIKDSSVLIDLTCESQENFLQKCKITYQGQAVSMDKVIDDETKGFIDAKLIWSLLNKDKIKIGRTLRTLKYDEIKSCYISRNLKCDGEEHVVDTLDDIDSKIVLISSKPCMGKSILLTHLSLETKKADNKPWIVRIDMSIQDDSIADIKSDNIKPIMRFLCNAALRRSNDLSQVDFIKINNETVDINREKTHDISFELQLFIHFYNSGNVIFLFDGFDKIYPHYTNEGLKLFTALKKAKKRVWITGDNYVIKILEDKFGPSYKLGPLSTAQQKSFLRRFWSTNLQLEKLNHEQCNNISLFINFIIKSFNDKVDITEILVKANRSLVPLFSVPLHLLYLTILDYFKNSARSLSPCYFIETFQKVWNFNRYTAVDRFLGRSNKDDSLELSSTPLHMYLAANYFVWQITDKFDFNLNTELVLDRSRLYLNTVTLYERFLKVNMKNICDIEINSSKQNQEILRDKFFSSHKKLALYALCREDDISKLLTEPEIREVKKTVKMIESGEIKTELIDCVVDGIPRFHHVIFAEYFLVEMLSDLIKRINEQNFDNGDIKLESIWDFLVNAVLVVSPPSLRNTFEYKLQYDPELAETVTNERSQKIIFQLLSKPNLKRNYGSASEALDIAINEGLVHVTNLLLKGVRSQVDDGDVDTFREVLKASATILDALDGSRSIVSDDVLKCMRNADGETLMQVLKTKPVGEDITDGIKTKIVEPIRRMKDKLLDISGHDQNLVRLTQEIPHHLPDIVWSLFKK